MIASCGEGSQPPSKKQKLIQKNELLVTSPLLLTNQYAALANESSDDDEGNNDYVDAVDDCCIHDSQSDDADDDNYVPNSQPEQQSHQSTFKSARHSKKTLIEDSYHNHRFGRKINDTHILKDIEELKKKCKPFLSMKNDHLNFYDKDKAYREYIESSKAFGNLMKRVEEKELPKIRLDILKTTEVMFRLIVNHSDKGNPPSD